MPTRSIHTPPRPLNAVRPPRVDDGWSPAVMDPARVAVADRTGTLQLPARRSNVGQPSACDPLPTARGPRLAPRAFRKISVT